MAPKRKAKQPAASTAAKRRAVASQSKVNAAVNEKAKLPVAESDSLDYKSFNKSRLVLFESVSPKGFESSAYYGGCNGMYHILEEGKLMRVEVVNRVLIERVRHIFDCSAMGVTLGWSIRLNQEGSAATYAPLVFVALRSSLPPMSMGSNLGGYRWPNGVLSYGISRTLPEQFEDGVAMLNASADGSMGKGIGFYVGIHEYSGTGQLVVFVLERRKQNRCAASSSSSSSSGGVSIVMREAVSCGTTGLSPSSVEVIKRVIEERGGGVRGVGIGASPACDKQGIPEYQLLLPTEMLFGEDRIPQCFPNDGKKVDLFRVQALLLRQDFGGGFKTDLCVGCEHCQ